MTRAQPKTRRTNKDADRPEVTPESRPPIRPYRLTPEGLISLRSSAARTRPWDQSTGPKSPEGKARSRMNAQKHGERSARATASRGAIARLMRSVREQLNG